MPSALPSLFEQALAALPDGVLLIGASRHVLYANPAFARHWRIPDALLATGDEASMLQYVADQLVDPVQFRREVERVHASSESFEDQIRFKDGRIFSRRSVPFVEDGVLAARIWVFTDVTEAHNASVDALTGLPNRRAYSRRFPAYMAEPADGFLRAVGMMDVDNFKAYNDRYGHAAGDAVLRSVGEVLRSGLKSSDDLVFRIGGEEFLVALRARNADAINRFFEALRQRVEALAIPHDGNPPYERVTASFGVAVFGAPPRRPRQSGSSMQRSTMPRRRAETGFAWRRRRSIGPPRRRRTWRRLPPRPHPARRRAHIQGACPCARPAAPPTRCAPSR